MDLDDLKSSIDIHRVIHDDRLWSGLIKDGIEASEQDQYVDELGHERHVMLKHRREALAYLLNEMRRLISELEAGNQE